MAPKNKIRKCPDCTTGLINLGYGNIQDCPTCNGSGEISLSHEKITKLPTDKEVEEWFVENIDEGCSASSAVYKFRLWLQELTPFGKQE